MRKIVSISLDAKTLERARQAAQQHELTLSAWVRLALRQAFGKGVHLGGTP